MDQHHGSVLNVEGEVVKKVKLNAIDDFVE